ncbi:hypothetical protein HK100_000554 [Physocladia obscura]|uniref:Transcription factor domain-containing protein n=1 Tax=Physocladia obscura TaxID=109957 RepID=A0AAD5T9G6_9FUNG|nr:hypothetical protein HK100_000554 [Physocladia obscura]
MQAMSNRLQKVEAELSQANETLVRLKKNSSNEIIVSQQSTIEDPDMMPSIGDWVVVFQYFRQPNLLGQLLNLRLLLEHFFTENQSLRLIVCALTAYLQTPSLPAKVCVAYYSRARKSINRHGNIVSLKHVQVFMLHSLFLLAIGQPTLARPLFTRAITMLMQLQLYIDPDNIPTTANLSDEEKEDRRTYSRVKYARRRYAHGYNGETTDPIFEIASHCYCSSIFEIILEAKSHWITPPSSVGEIFSTTFYNSIGSSLGTLKGIIPSYRLLSTDPNSNSLAQFMSYQQQNPYTQQQYQQPPQQYHHHHLETIIDRLLITIFYNSAICIINRPLLYVSKFLPLTSPYLLHNPDRIKCVLNALDASVTAAQTILSFADWIVVYQRPESSSKIWKEQTFSIFALFEAIIVLWFALCHTQRFWWRPETVAGVVLSERTTSAIENGGGSGNVFGDTLQMGVQERRRIRVQILDVLKSLKEAEAMFGNTGSSENASVDQMILDENDQSGGGSGGGHPNMITPIVVAIEAMIREIQEAEVAVIETNEKFEAVLKGITLGMKVVAIVDDDEEFPKQMEPFVFLGLLGMEVSGLNWNASNEQPWRNFWYKVINEQI